MSQDIRGLHHVTAIAGDAQANHDFYVRGLGLRLVKRTVNFDDPGAWHLYYGDRTGAPGTVMTFFVWPGARRGAPGAGQVAVTQFAVPRGALAFWRERLPRCGATPLDRAAPFGETAAFFADPDGIILMLVETDDPRAPWTTEGVGADVAVRGFRGVTLSLRDGAGAARVLTDAFGYARAAQEGAATRFCVDGPAGVVDILSDPSAPASRDGAGTVHHVAFAVADGAAQLRARARMEAVGLRVTPPIDRDYFHAIYARTPGGVLFEVATEDPGFTVDEPVERLGSALKLPRQHAPMRAAIEAVLPPLAAEGDRTPSA